MTLYLEHSARGANAWWRYGLTVLVAAALTIALGMAVAAGLELAHLAPTDVAGQLLNPGDPVAFFVATGGLFALILAGFVAAVWLVHRKRPRDLLGRWSWRHFLAGMATWAVLLSVTSLIDFAIAPQGFSVTANRETPLLIMAALPALAVQTFTEEIIFRGWITQGLLLALKRPLPAALISGLAFGALHIPNGWPQAANATIFGLVTAMIAIRTGGIALSYGLHLANNLFAGVILVSSHDAFRGAPGLLAQSTPQLMWWDAAVGVVALVVVAAAVILRRDRPVR